MTGYVLRDIIRRQGRRARRLARQEPTMTEHDTTDHVAAIREIAETWIAIAEFQDMLGVLADIKEIPGHLDALAARLAAAEAERDAERERCWRFALHIVALEEWAKEDAVDEYATLKNYLSDGVGSDVRPEELAKAKAYYENGDLPTTDGSDDDA